VRGSVVECANAKHCAAVSFNSSGRSAMWCGLLALGQPASSAAACVA
jgi:hypothetical protein